MTGRGGIVDISGKIFGRLKVKRLALPEEKPPIKEAKSKAYWICECACGGKGVYCGKELRRGKVQSCGCFYRNINVRTRWKDYLATVPTQALKRELQRRARLAERGE